MQIELRDIRKTFGLVRANDGISLDLEGGRIYGLLGENGAGKSTLMKILSGYQRQDSGQILLDDAEIAFESPAAALSGGVGMLYQDPLDMPPFTVIENFQLGRDKRLPLHNKSASAELREITGRYNFELDQEALIESLSLGERQQLELVRLLAGGARVLILDEPTTGISAEQKEMLFSSMRTMAREEGRTLILVSHKLEEVQDLCDYAFVLRGGHLVGEIEIPCPNEKLVEMMFGHIPVRSRRQSFVLGRSILQIKDLKVSDRRLTISDINLSVNAGEVFGLAGLEGSGQGQLIKGCAGLLKPENGQILLEGKEVNNWSFHRRQKSGIAYVAAGRLEEGLVAGLTLTEHLVLAQPKHRFFIDWAGARSLMKERIQEYQIIGRPDSKADELSGGNQQRLLFGLLNRPLKLLLLEHPTRGLDVRSTNYTWELLYLRRQEATAILFLSADLDEIIERCDRIAVFFGGRMSRIVDAKTTTADELGYMIGGQA